MNPQTDEQYPQTNEQYPQTDEQYPETDDQYPETDEQYPETDEQYPETDEQYPNTDAQFKEEEKEKLNIVKVGGISSDKGVDSNYARNFFSDERFYRTRITKDQIKKQIEEEMEDEDDEYLALNELMPSTKIFSGASVDKNKEKKNDNSIKKRKFNSKVEQVQSLIKEKYGTSDKKKEEIEKYFIAKKKNNDQPKKKNEDQPKKKNNHQPKKKNK